MSDNGLKFAEAMAPAFEEALRDIRELQKSPSVPIMGFMGCQQAVSLALESIDWQEHGIEAHPFEDDTGEVRDMEPKDYANRLLSFAFGDAFSIITLCEKAASNPDVPSDVSLGELLINGTHSLLAISRVNDRNKSRLITAIDLGDHHPNIVGRIADVPDVGNPIIYVGGDKPKLVWSEDIQAWLDERRAGGCPAHAQKIELDGKKISAVYFFWNKLIQVMYPPNQ